MRQRRGVGGRMSGIAGDVAAAVRRRQSDREPRVVDPPRTFDQMKLAAKRMAHTLSAELVDDNRRSLDDPALAAIRDQVQSASDALVHYGIEPGSPRAIALFGA